jgi:hypothetical protein
MISPDNVLSGFDPAAQNMRFFDVAGSFLDTLLSSPQQSDWNGYYARTVALPVDDPITGQTTAETVRDFLGGIPQGGRVLDYGTGTGRWAKEFSTQRPDLTIDVVDQNIGNALLPHDWKGKKISSQFEDFQPSHPYNGVWARSAFYFLSEKDFRHALMRLSKVMPDQAVLEFNHVDPSDGAAEREHFHGVTRQALENALTSAGFESAISEKPDAFKGQTREVIKGYYVRARKQAAGQGRQQ